MKLKDYVSDQRARILLIRYASPVLKSDIFHKAMKQVHHGHTTVGIHSLKVAEMALKLGLLVNVFIPINLKSLTIGALCHDLGIVGRYSKYKNNLECCFKHPLDSVKVTGKIFPDLDKKTKRILKSHMFPQGIHIPTSIEGYLVVISDKYISAAMAMESKKKS